MKSDEVFNAIKMLMMGFMLGTLLRIATQIDAIVELIKKIKP